MLSAPQNQYNGPLRVTNQPAGLPAGPLKVAPKPATPLPAMLPVTSRPANQQQSLGVQPPVPQPQIQVDNSPRFARLGDTVKAKYPGAYDDIDSGQLGKLVAAKYPGVYDEFITPGQPEQQLPEGRGGLAGFGIGIAKGAANTLNNLSGFGQKALKTITGIDAPTSTLNPKVTTPTSTAQKIGFGTEQVVEFLIPGGEIGKGVSAVEKATAALPKAARLVANLGARAGLEGLGAAGMTALQGGDEKDIKTAGILGGAFGVISKPLENLLKNIPDTAWSSILKRTPTEASKKPNLPAEAAKTGMTSFTRQGLANEAQRNVQRIEVALDDLLTRTPGKVGTLKIAPYLDELRNAYAAIPGEQASVEAIDAVMRDFLKKKSLTLKEANDLKRKIYENISRSYGRGMLEVPVKTDAQKAIAAGLKREIEKVIPEAKTLNERQAVYIQIKKALDKTIARTEGKGIAGTGVGLYDLLIGGIGTGAGAVTGTPLLGLGAVALKKTGESPIVLSSVAKLLNYFNQLSPTKKLLFYEALKGMTVKGGVEITGSAQKSK